MSAEAIVADAIERIPVEFFANRAWTRRAVASCVTFVAAAIERDGDARYDDVVRDLIYRPERAVASAVISAVCEAFVADRSFHHRDVAAVSRSVARHERAIRRTLDLRLPEEPSMIAPEHAELAAGLVRVVAMHDAATATHLQATSILARRIALHMDLAADVVSTTEIGGLLHDIGKVSIRPEILDKPGPLDAREWVEMKLHPITGAAVLLGIPKLAFVAPIVRGHHERIDGHGYPDRLRGEEIPIEARIIAVADAFHAMTTQRPYRDALLPSAALAVLGDHGGTQFDSEAVRAAADLFGYVRRKRRDIAS